MVFALFCTTSVKNGGGGANREKWQMETVWKSTLNSLIFAVGEFLSTGIFSSPKHNDKTHLSAEEEYRNTAGYGDDVDPPSSVAIEPGNLAIELKQGEGAKRK